MDFLDEFTQNTQETETLDAQNTNHQDANPFDDNITNVASANPFSNQQQPDLSWAMDDVRKKKSFD